MRIELVTDTNASLASHIPVLDFRVHLALGERRTRELNARVAALAWSAADAWEVVHDTDWKGRCQ
jgi:hypothetical protein